MYMEDLYVTPEHRNKGLGQTLWKRVVKVGSDFELVNSTDL